MGLSDFKIDIAVKKPDDAYWRTAILLDTRTWYMRPTVIDRDGISELLKGLKRWPSVARVWLPGWVRDQAGELERLVKIIEEAPPYVDRRAEAPRLADVLAAEHSRAQASEGATPEYGHAQVSEGVAPEHGHAQVSEGVVPEHGCGSASGAVAVAAPDIGAHTENRDGRNAEAAAADKQHGNAELISSDRCSGSTGQSCETDIRDGGPSQMELSQSLVMELADFTPAPRDPLYPKGTLNRLNTAYPVVCAGVQEILSIEGPVLIDRLITIIYKRCGYTRLGAAKQRELTMLIRTSFAVDAAGFVWASGVDPNLWGVVRRTANRGDRALEEVCTKEIENAMTLVLRESLSIGHDELIAETGHKLGYDRIGAENRTRLGAIIAKGLAERRLIEEQGRLRLG
jgi:hypothetical protein